MIFIISSLFILFSCKDKVILKKKEVVLIKAPISFYPNRTFPLELSEDKSLIQFKWKKNELYIVDKNQSFFKKYFEKYQDAFVESKDSIFLINKETGKILLINSKFDTLSSWQIPIWINNSKYNIFINHSSNFIKYQNKLYLTIFPAGFLDTFYTKQNEIIYDLKTQRVEKLYMRFPKIYSNNSWWGSTGNRVSKILNNKGEIIFHYPMLNNILIMKNNSINEIKLAKSKYLKSFPPQSQIYPPPDNKYVFEYTIQTPLYYSLFYDKFHDLYFRIVAHKQSLYKNSLKNTIISRDWSIMIFDNNFKLLKEIKMEGGKYFYDSIFILEDGIYILKQDDNNFDGNIILQKFEVEYDK